MIIVRKSPLSNKTREWDLPITQDQIDRWMRKEAPIQEIMPQLSDNQREFLMTGLTPDEWDLLFPEDEEE